MDFLTIISLIAIAAAAGFLGTFALMRRMALASDAMSHIALPGIAIALSVGINPFIGGLAMLLAGSLIIWGLETKTKIATETIIGVIFSASLAIGSMLATDFELLEALFGNVDALTKTDLLLGLFGSLIVIGALLVLKNKIVMSLFSPDIAKTMGINNSRLNLSFLVLFAVAIVLGLKFLGVLLMGSLIIIPAAVSKNLAPNLKSDFLISIATAIISVGLGSFISLRYGLDLGPVIIATATGLFFLSILFTKEVR